MSPFAKVILLPPFASRLKSIFGGSRYTTYYQRVTFDLVALPAPQYHSSPEVIERPKMASKKAFEVKSPSLFWWHALITFPWWILVRGRGACFLRLYDIMKWCIFKCAKKKIKNWMVFHIFGNVYLHCAAFGGYDKSKLYARRQWHVHTALANKFEWIRLSYVSFLPYIRLTI